MGGGIQLRESDYEVNSKWNWLNVVHQCTSAPFRLLIIILYLTFYIYYNIYKINNRDIDAL
jgi:hypothetical protein